MNKEIVTLAGSVITAVSAIAAAMLNNNADKIIVGLGSAAFLFISMYIIFVYLRNKNSNKNFDNRNHRFFTKAKFWKTIYIPNLEMNINNPKKNRMVKTFLTVMIESYEKNLLNDLCVKAVSCCCDKMPKLFVDIIKEYEQTARDKEIPELFIESFRKWHEPAMNFMIDFSSNICRADFIPCNQKVHVILDILTAAFELTLIDAVQTIKNINGELDAALDYKKF